MKTTIQTAAPSDYGKQYAFSITLKGGECPQPLHPKGYFSITGDIYHKATRTRTGDGTRACGCLHEETLKAFPPLAFLVSLHLSDASTGEPTHAESNGFYILAGAVPEMRHLGCEYHAGNAKQHSPIKGNPPEGKPWATTEYREPTPEECLERLARHLRCSLEEARAIREACVNAAKAAPAVPVSVPYPLNTREHREAVKAAEKAREAGPREAAFKVFAALVAEMRPRWAQEAAQGHRQIAAIANRRSGEKVSAAIQRANLVK